METKVRRLRHKYEPGQIEREVPVLFPQTEAECTPEEIAFYRRIKAEHGAFAFAIDRQSVRREALRKGATGMLRRVQNIHLGAEHLGIYLPAAAHLPDAPDGTLPFQFDENFWYVDGTAQQATGYAANQHARPRLWRAFLLAQALAKHGCAPKAFLIGEATRFFRDEGWLTTFVRALGRRKVQIYVAGFGEVTKDTLPGLVAYINALSGWLGKVNEAAREIKRKSGAIYHRNAPLMLMFSPDGQEVFAEPTYWPIMGRMLEALATGELTSATGAAAWLKQFGVERTYVWVCNFVHGSIPDGIYDKAYSSQWIQRVLKQKGGLFCDLDITESGNRRHLMVPREGLRKPIQHIHGTEPFPAEVVLAARHRIRGRRGRPGKRGPRPDILVPPRILRCSCCGYGVQEQNPEGNYWRLHCMIPWALSRKYKIPYREAIKLEEAQHTVLRRGRASEAIWTRVWQALKQNPVLPTGLEDDEELDSARRERSVQETRAAYEKFQNEVADGRYGDERDEIDGEWIRRRREELKKALRTAQREAEGFASRSLTQSRHRAAWNEVREALADVVEWELSAELKRSIIDRLIDTVTLDLQTGEFVIEGALDVPFLRRVTGRLENTTDPMGRCTMA